MQREESGAFIPHDCLALFSNVLQNVHKLPLKHEKVIFQLKYNKIAIMKSRLLTYLEKLQDDFGFPSG
jgi:hypothetical protein